MPMAFNGLVKLMEECGELQQIAAKKIQYFNTDQHPDGEGSLKLRMEDEIADVIAAIQFCVENFKLDADRIEDRACEKLELFTTWSKEP